MLLPPSPSCPGHSDQEISTLVTNVLSVYARFYAAQLATLNANDPQEPSLTVIPEGDEEALDQLSYYDLGPAYSSWTLPPYPLLGSGAFRVTLGLCPEHALKVNPGLTNHNVQEAALWTALPEHLRPLFVPVLLVDPADPPLWLIAQRAQPLIIDRDSDFLAEQFSHLLDGLEDLHSGQLGRLHGALVILDYGNLNDDFSALLRQFPDPSAAVSLLG